MVNSLDIFRICEQQLKDAAVADGATDAALQAALAVETLAAIPYAVLGLLAHALSTRDERDKDCLAVAGLPLWPQGVGRAPRTHPARARTARLHALANALFLEAPQAGLVDVEGESDAAIERLRASGTDPSVIERWSRLRPATMIALSYGLSAGGCRCEACRDARRDERGAAV